MNPSPSDTSNGHIAAAFSMLIEEFERAIHDVSLEGARAFGEKRFAEIADLADAGRSIESFQSKVVALEEEWSSQFSQPETKQGKGKWSKQSPCTQAAFHEDCVAKASKYLKAEFAKQTRTSFVSKDNQIALIVLISRVYPKGEKSSFWFSFYPYQSEFLFSKPKGYLLLGCGSSENIVLIPFSDFQPWNVQLNKSIREDESFYSHIRIDSGDGGFMMKLQGKGNHVDLKEYRLPVA